MADAKQLKIYDQPQLRDARMLLGFSGWMDGGETSTGTVEYLRRKLKAKRVAEIESEDFYIYSFPGSMEIASLFRPHTKIEDGRILQFEEPKNTFYCDPQRRLILFEGKEPNFRWSQYAECILSAAERFNVSMIYFVGSVAGLVPHTREPRFFASVSEPQLMGELLKFGMRQSNYEGPASIVTYLTVLCRQRGLYMVNLVAEIPAYVQGRNARCVEAVVRKLSGMLDLRIDFSDLQVVSDELEKRLNKIVKGKPELAKYVSKLEEDYDNEVFDTQLGDLKQWLQQQGIRLD